MVIARTVLAAAAQALAAGLFSLQRHPTPFAAAAAWWTVWGSLVDLGCLAGLYWLLRREGLRLLDLVGLDRRRLGRDVLLGLAYVAVLFPVCIVGGSLLSSWLIFNTLDVPLYPGLLSARVLPAWGAVYSAAIWWVIWSLTEELAYNGYALPRLEVLTRRRWLAVAVVGLFWAVQHAALPVIWDARYLVWKTLSFIPVAVAMAALYARTRRLLPLVVAHWAMDVAGVVMTIAW
jgi:membrane protease YdiL (CAAX protease family)